MASTTTQFDNFLLQIKHDQELLKQALNFYDQKLGKEIRERCAVFIEDEQRWRSLAEMSPYEMTLYEDMKKSVNSGHDQVLNVQIDGLKEAFGNNEKLATVLKECLHFERSMLTQLSEGLLPDKSSIDDIIRDCSKKIQDLNRKLQEYEMYGASQSSQVDLQNLGHLIGSADGSAHDVVNLLIQARSIWLRVQQLQQFITEEPPPPLNPLQKEFESIGAFLLKLNKYLLQLLQYEKESTPQLINAVRNLMNNLIENALILEEQPKQNIKLQKQQATKEFELKVSFLLGKTLLNNACKVEEAPKVSLSFDCGHNLVASDRDKHIHGFNVVNNEGFLTCATGRMDWSCSAHMKKITVIHFRQRCKGESNSESVSEQKYGIKVTVNIPDNGFGNSRKLQVISLPIIVTTQTSQDWTAAATLLWDNAFAEPDRVGYKVSDRVPWTKMSLILSEKFRANIGRGLSADHLKYLRSKALHGGSRSSSEITWLQFVKKSMENVQFSFWKWYYAVHNLCSQHLRNAWTQGLVEGFIDKKDVKRKLREPHIYGQNFILRFSDSTIEENESSLFGGSLVVCYVTKDGQNPKADVSFVEPVLAGTFSTTKLCNFLSTLEEERALPSASSKIALEYLYPNRPFHEAFHHLLIEEVKDEVQVEKPIDPDDYKKLKKSYKFKSGTSDNTGNFPLRNMTSPPAPPNMSVASPASSHHSEFSSYPDPNYRGVTSPGSSMLSPCPHSEAAWSETDPLSPAMSYHTAAGSPQSNFGIDGLSFQEVSPNVVTEQLEMFNPGQITLNSLNYEDNSSGATITELTRYLLDEDVDMVNVDIPTVVPTLTNENQAFIPSSCQ